MSNAEEVLDDTTRTEKVRENRVRRMAKRQRLTLMKSRRRDPYAPDFGGFMLVDANNVAVYGAELGVGYELDLDQVETWLTQ